SRAGGVELVVTGTGLGGTFSVQLGGQTAAFHIVSDGEIRVTAPPAASAGPADLVVQDTGGPSTRANFAVLYIDDLVGQKGNLAADHGPVAGGDTVVLSFTSSKPVAPGTQVLVGGVAAEGVNVIDLSTIQFVTPRGAGAAVVPVQLVRPGESPVSVGT